MTPDGSEQPQRQPEGASWFGYIGLGIALASMLLGIAAMVIGIYYAVTWLQK